MIGVKNEFEAGVSPPSFRSQMTTGLEGDDFDVTTTWNTLGPYPLYRV